MKNKLIGLQENINCYRSEISDINLYLNQDLTKITLEFEKTDFYKKLVNILPDKKIKLDYIDEEELDLNINGEILELGLSSFDISEIELKEKLKGIINGK